ncbi:Similar to CCDC191: Coiled-coil domain-containing protein 191 (Macaca fascicularis) [Cotesia congregata]|uniref:Similar to CCDC191: Coiled-coil domain-containing protein 191 (Macaca fascicularis) n=1 Tax=Cotesia congregata TaxID=51543 RepID=A0A8J2HTN6_COTCN|nr:Similar to CCDC191: Coiled-coil domain-containing protein 191 (Macaca fascicularis) [Cotesia congregata]
MDAASILCRDRKQKIKWIFGPEEETVDLPPFETMTQKINFQIRTSRHLENDEYANEFNVQKIEIIKPKVEEHSGDISVTIKDKPSSARLKEENREILKNVFEELLNHARESKRLKLLQSTLERIYSVSQMKRYFDRWRMLVDEMKFLNKSQKKEYEIEDVTKIELFISAIRDKQKNVLRCTKKKNMSVDTKDLVNTKAKTNLNVSATFANRLKMQKKVIDEQRSKLAEQNRLIQDMKLQQIQVESKLSELETLKTAKGAFAHSKKRSQKILRQLMLREGIDSHEVEEVLSDGVPKPNPPIFLARMEARALARRERVARRELERKQKLEEQKLREEMAKMSEREAARKKVELEAQEKARQIRRRHEEERERALNIEKLKKAMQEADDFYRKYLLRRYILCPLIAFVQSVHDDMNKAERHYDLSILRKTFVKWKSETEQKIQIKMELSIDIYNRNLTWRVFESWLQLTRNNRKIYKTAVDHCNNWLKKSYYDKWLAYTLSMKIINNNNQEVAFNFYNEKLKSTYFKLWKKYLLILDKVEETDKRKDQLRQLVQSVIPDFAPQHRGVIID